MQMTSRLCIPPFFRHQRRVWRSDWCHLWYLQQASPGIHRGPSSRFFFLFYSICIENLNFSGTCSGSGSLGRILPAWNKNSKKSLISTVLWLCKSTVHVPSKSTILSKKIVFVVVLKVTDEKSSIRIRFVRGTADPHQNVMDPEHCWTLYHNTHRLSLYLLSTNVGNLYRKSSANH